MREKYEGNIGSYSFLMTDDNTIEIWIDSSSEYPDSFIYLKDGAIRSKKDFDYEIMAWYANTIGE